MSSRVRNTEVLDSLLMKKKAGFLDSFGPPKIPRYFAPQSFGAPLGMARGRKKKDIKQTQKREYELWEKWNRGGRKKEDLEPLYQSFKPFLSNSVHQELFTK